MNPTTDMWAKIETDAYRKLVKEDGEGIQIARVNPLTFFRMLAKIAHGITAAQVGLCNFTPLLTDLILGNAMDVTDPIRAWRSVGYPEEALQRAAQKRIE